MKSIAYQSQCTSCLQDGRDCEQHLGRAQEPQNCHGRTVHVDEDNRRQSGGSWQALENGNCRGEIGHTPKWGRCNSWCASCKRCASYSLPTWISSASCSFWTHAAYTIYAICPPGTTANPVSFKPNSGDSSQSWRLPRNPPSAAYSGQEVPSKNSGYLEVVDEAGNKRAVSPTGREQVQTDSLNASYVPKGWMLVPQSGKVHRLYS